MKYIAAILTTLALVAVPVYLLAQADDEPSGSETIVEVVEVAKLGVCLPGKVISVHDGDTLKVEFRIVADIRLLDCWAPEITGATKEDGIRSRENLKRLAEGKPCIVHVPMTSDNIGKATSMGRVLGKVMVNGDDLSYEQVKARQATKTKADK